MVPPALKGLAVTHEAPSGLCSGCLESRLSAYRVSQKLSSTKSSGRIQAIGLFVWVGVRVVVFVASAPQHAPLLSITGTSGLQSLLLRA